MRVAQVLLQRQPAAQQDAVSPEQLLTRAREIRQEVLAGTITFADAARKYSESPSGRSGGQLDWISRDGPMPDVFTRAAFELEAGGISEPIVSPYGVHLIQCLEVAPGDKTWRDARDELTDAVSQYLFRWLVDRPRPQQNIQFMETTPHFQPGTRQLVVPPTRQPTKRIPRASRQGSETPAARRSGRRSAKRSPWDTKGRRRRPGFFPRYSVATRAPPQPAVLFAHHARDLPGVLPQVCTKPGSAKSCCSRPRWPR